VVLFYPYKTIVVMRSTKLIMLGICCLLLTWNLQAQINSSLKNDGLSILDQGAPARGADYKIGGVLVQNGFAFSQITDQLISAGSDLVRSKIDGSGFNMRQFAVLPYKEVDFDFDGINFAAVDDTAFPANDRIDWNFGFTDLGDFDNSDQLERAFFIDYTRFQSEIFLQRRLLFVNPDDGSFGINPGIQENFNAQLRVYGGAGIYGIYAQNPNISGGNTGIRGIADGNGTGYRVGVWGTAANSSGTKYGIWGYAAGGSGTNYAVYANGDLAYTGDLDMVSDQKLKKDIDDFDGLETILQLRPRTYQFKRDEFEFMNLSDGKQFGFIAQEVREIIPEMVAENKHLYIDKEEDEENIKEEPYLGLRPLLLLPILTRALQEEHEIVEDQGTRIRHLEQENQVLRNRLAELETKMEQVLGQQPGGDSDPVVLTSARLDQNFPNPYDQETAIGLFIPESVQNAELRIINAEGRVMRTIVIDDRGETKQLLAAKALQAGSYFYSLVLDGTPFSTKQMLLLK